MSVGDPLVLAAVEDHTAWAQVDQQREAGLVRDGRGCGGEVTLLPGRCGAVARHGAEDGLPVLDPAHPDRA